MTFTSEEWVQPCCEHAFARSSTLGYLKTSRTHAGESGDRQGSSKANATAI